MKELRRDGIQKGNILSHIPPNTKNMVFFPHALPLESNPDQSLETFFSNNSVRELRFFLLSSVKRLCCSAKKLTIEIPKLDLTKIGTLSNFCW